MARADSPAKLSSARCLRAAQREPDTHAHSARHLQPMRALRPRLLRLDERRQAHVHGIVHAIDQDDVDPDGNCKWLYDTLPGGAAATAVGGALTTAGVTLLVVCTKRRSRTELQTSPGGLRLRF